MLVAMLLPVLVLARPAMQTRFDASSEIWFLEGDSSLRAYDEFLDRFGGDEFLVLVLETESGSVFENDRLQSLVRVSREADRLAHVEEVTSLATTRLIRAAGDEIRFEEALPPLPASADVLEETRRRVLADRLAPQWTVSPDGRMGFVLVRIENRPGEYRHRLELVAALRSLLDAEGAPLGTRYRIMGDAVLHEDLFGKVNHDLRWNLPVVGLLITLVLAVTFRSIPAVALSLAVVLAALVIARSTAMFLGWKDNTMLTVVPVVVLVTGVADSVHIVDRFFTGRRAGRSPEEASAHAVRSLFRPCLFTSITTAVGFLGLTLSPLLPLRQLGVLAATGVSAAFAFSVLALPAALTFVRGVPRADSPQFTRVLDRGLGRIPAFVRRRRGLVLALAVLLSVLALVGVFRLRTESRYLEAFRRDDPVRLLAEWVEERAGGLASVQIVVTSETPGGLLEPAALRAMDGLGEVLRTQPIVTRTHSAADLFKAIHEVMHEGDPAYHRVPESRALVAQYMLLEDVASPAGGMDGFLDPSGTYGRIWARARFGTATQYDAMERAVAEYVAASFPAGVSVEVTGTLTLFRNMSGYVVRSQVRSFSFAFLLVTLCMTVIMGSIRFGLLSLVPNLWPILLAVGWMGWVGWWLEPASAMVAAVALGIAVDDTVHFLANYREARRTGAPAEEAVQAMFRNAGRAVVVTTVILVLGFGVTLFSALQETARFGALCMISLGLALVADLFLLPALLSPRLPSSAHPGEPQRLMN